MSASTCAEAIREAMNALGGEADIKEVENWLDNHYPDRWKDISTTMADLTFPGNKSSNYAPEQRYLERVSRGRYRLRGWQV